MEPLSWTSYAQQSNRNAALGCALTLHLIMTTMGHAILLEVLKALKFLSVAWPLYAQQCNDLSSWCCSGLCVDLRSNTKYCGSCNVTVNIFIARLTLCFFLRHSVADKKQCSAAQVCTGSIWRFASGGVYCSQTAACVSCDAAFNSYLSFNTHITKVCGQLNMRICRVHNRLMSKQSCLSTASLSKGSFNMCKTSID